MRQPRSLLLLLALGGACHGALLAAEGGGSAHLKPGWEIRLAPPGEPGQPVVVQGVVQRADGSPAAGAMLYLHQADYRGVYPPGQDPREMHRAGPLSGWLRTDPAGRYRIVTVRPGTPAGSAAAARIHVRLHRGGQGAPAPLPDFVFPDDRRATPTHPGMIRGARGADGVWRGTRTIVLPAGR